jgi:hypothetical protein
MVENKTNYRLSSLRTDRRVEYMFDAFTSNCRIHGIRRQLIALELPSRMAWLDTRTCIY